MNEWYACHSFPVPRCLRAPASHRLGLLQGLFTTEPFPATVLAPLLPAGWAVRLLVQSAGSIAVVNYLVPALFVSRKDLWGESILPGDFHLLCAYRLAPSPPPRPHPSAALNTPAPSDAFSSSLASFEPNTGRG